ncbi:MAG: exo-alpha-sialidase [Clostridiales bacterium]|nr:exo-alpha-sialidase [Clostridiales bacterium]
MNTEFISVVYDNPLPQLRSRQAAFPNLTQLRDGTILCAFQIGEAFESVDGASYLSRSTDGGRTWSVPNRMFPCLEVKVSESCKVTALSDGSIIAVGYRYYRQDPRKPIGNPETGGLLDDDVFISHSFDDGITWSEQEIIRCRWGQHVEASAPITELHDGSLVTPITGFPDWDGNMTDTMCGRLLKSINGGKTWYDDTICMSFPSNKVTCYEQRACQLPDGRIVVIGWNEDTESGDRMNNHITVSCNNGSTFSTPFDTGIRGQASSVLSIGGNRILSLHAIRRDTDKPGIYGYISNLSSDRWSTLDSFLLWEPSFPIMKDYRMAEIFSSLKFGQPGAIMLSDGSVLASFWYAEQGQYKIKVIKLSI